MGKRSIAKFLAVVPLTATIAVNTTVSQNKNDIQFDSSNTKTKYYEIDKKYKVAKAPELAIEIAADNTGDRSASKLPKSTLKVAEALPMPTAPKIILASAQSAKVKKVDILDDQKGSKSDSSDKDTTLSQSQLDAIKKMVSGYPIEKMLPYISQRRPETAAFLVAIAKKESNWGKVSPKSSDGDCFNYWGFKDHRFKFAAGHSCFPSREVAIETVGNRIDKLVASGRNTPVKISIWKCGSACSKDGNVGKWIGDVNMYFQPIIAAATPNQTVPGAGAKSNIE